MKRLLLLLIVEVFNILCNPTPSQCGYYADINDPNGGGSLCKYSIAGCRLCNFNTCVQCLDGFYMNQQICLSCADILGSGVAKCALQNNQVKGTQCLSGYYLDQNTKTCFACGSYCNACYDATTCISCIDGAYLQQNTCLICSSALLNCCGDDGNGNCLKCNPTYYLNAGSCFSCGVAHCKQCTNTSTCSACITGYFLQDPNTCVQNPTNCQQACTTTGLTPNTLKCVQCINDIAGNNQYYPDSSGVCQTCALQNCQLCSSQNQCQQCSSGYTAMSYTDSNNINNIKCYNCQTNCNRCQMQGSQKICYQCIDSFTVNQGQCMNTIQFSWNTIEYSFNSIVSYSVLTILYLMLSQLL